MKTDVTTLEATKSGSVDLNESVYGLELRADLLHRMVNYQLASRQAGTHKTKNRSEIVGTTKKFGRQKGGGGARHGNRKSNIFVGGGRAHGPVVRSHATKLPKKVRTLALKTALSSKVQAAQLIVLDKAESKHGKTSVLRNQLTKLGITSALIIDGSDVNENFARAARNIEKIDVLPVQGINVYDILRRDHLVLTKAAIESLEERFK
ncbi:MAG: 50S ribosomal protein L4 [PS1 clade bacterium]|uniref:Large ribosomal subunit protein uL4 n=1 Tax=PS1 clade bacterium TaxID=2175152 RepID=A0A368E1J1_9PROT|nr:MAG: 50S ribosomal protein L4 [PS1 clade bacterium]